MQSSGTLTVHFTDGSVEHFSGVRFNAAASDPDPIEYRDGVLMVETTDERFIRIYGARWSEFTAYDDPWSSGICEHGLSSDLCDGPGHYPPDNPF